MPPRRHDADGFVKFIVAFVLGLANDPFPDAICGLLWKSVFGYNVFFDRWGTWGGRSADRLTPVNTVPIYTKGKITQ
jgi:hypothetical protein